MVVITWLTSPNFGRATAGEDSEGSETMSDADLHVGLVGYGMSGSVFHAPLIAVTPGMRLAAVVTSDAVRRRRAEQDFPGAVVVPTVDVLVKEIHPLHLVVVASANRTHVPIATAAVRAGIPVVVEKPIAATVAEAQELVSEARSRRVLLTVYQNRRWDGDFLTVRRLLDAGTLGDPLRFESNFERWRPTPKPGFRESDAPEDAGGLLYDIGSHLIDQAIQLFGPVVEVFSEVDRRRPGVSVDDDTFVALRHASGVRSHLYATVMSASPGPRMRLIGTEGAFTKFGLDVQEEALKAGARPGPGWGEERPEQWGTLSTGDSTERIPTEPGRYQEFYRLLSIALRTGAPPPVLPETAIDALRVIEQIRNQQIRNRVL
jgi:predicted dehydrogenase